MRINHSVWLGVIAIFALTIPSQPALAQDEEELAKKLANPVASLISVPIIFAFDHNIGPRDEGERYSLTIKPVIPFSFNEDWNLISRTIVPVVYQDDISPGSGDQFGLGDTVLSFFFSPVQPTSNGLIWGVGPTILFPTATDDLLGSKKWALGPTGLILKQAGPWTYGMLASHTWDVAGDDDRDDINNTLIQPFVSYTTPKAWNFSLSTETTFSWDTDQWSIPITLGVSKLTKLGKLPVSYRAGIRYWADSTDNGPQGWGVELGIVYLFPK